VFSFHIIHHNYDHSKQGSRSLCKRESERWIDRITTLIRVTPYRLLG